MSVQSGDGHAASSSRDSKKGQNQEVDVAAKASDVVENPTLVYLHMAGNLSLSLVVQTARSQLLSEICKGDIAKMALIAARWQSTVAMLEFLFNPTIGKLSDRIGRRPFMLIGPIMSSLMKSLVMLKPSLLTLSMEKIVCDSLRTLSGSTMCNAALLDLYAHREGGQKLLARSLAGLQSAIGLGNIAGTLVATLLTRSGEARHAYAVGALASAALVAVESLRLRESLSESRRIKGGAGVFVNPLQFTCLFLRRKLGWLSLIQLFQMCTDPKNYSEVFQIFQMQLLKWTTTQCAVYQLGFGMGMSLSSPVQRTLIPRFGMRSYTSLTHVLTMVAFGLLSQTRSTLVMWIVAAIRILSETRDIPVKARCAAAAVESGMGKGEYSGYAANLRALMVSLSAQVYGVLLAKGVQQSSPGLPFLGGLGFIVVAEGILQTTPQSFWVDP